jgi:hypothetical protein
MTLLGGTLLMNMQKINKYDILKTIGLLGIISAHIQPPPPTAIFQLRDFDVPLMVLVSGMLFAKTYPKSYVNYFQYVKKRFYRLLVPTWVFMFFSFSVIYLLSWIFAVNCDISGGDILSQFLLRNRGPVFGVWIIRVFLLVAIVAPLMMKIFERTQHNLPLNLLLIVALYLIYELLYLFCGDYLSPVFVEIIFYLLPYSCVFGLGILLEKIEKRTLIIITIAFGVAFVSMVVVKCFAIKSLGELITHHEKFPPRMYYISYAMVVSLFIYCAIKNYEPRNCYVERFIKVMSSLSLEIYLWHHVYLYLWDKSIYSKLKSAQESMLVFLLVYIVIVIISCLTAFYVNRVKEKMVQKQNSSG